MDQLANINADLYDGTRIYRRRSDHLIRRRSGYVQD